MAVAVSAISVSGSIGALASALNRLGIPGSTKPSSSSTAGSPAPAEVIRVCIHVSNTSRGDGTPKPCPTGALCRSWIIAESAKFSAIRQAAASRSCSASSLRVITLHWCRQSAAQLPSADDTELCCRSR